MAQGLVPLFSLTSVQNFARSTALPMEWVVTATSSHFLSASKDSDYYLPGTSVPMLSPTFHEEILLDIQCELLLVHLETTFACSVTYLEEEANSHLATPSFPVVVESDKVFPEPPFLQG